MISAEKVIDLIKEAGTGVDESKLNPSAVLTDIGADSLDMMSIILAVQEATDLEIPDEDLDGLRTVNDIVVYVNERISGATKSENA
ncbi:MAG: acyl carrier protein [Gammaproteobacteria bacterium]|nr:MAG: acyl carrier protein [Gammaproteobacteria bacterium]